MGFILHGVCQQLPEREADKLFLTTLKHINYILQVLIVYISNGRSAELIQVVLGTPTSIMGLVSATKYVLILQWIGLSGLMVHFLLQHNNFSWQQQETWEGHMEIQFVSQNCLGLYGCSRLQILCWQTKQSFYHSFKAFTKTKGLFARFKSRQEGLFHGYKALIIMGGAAFCHKSSRVGEPWERLVVHKVVFDATTAVMQYNM